MFWKKKPATAPATAAPAATSAPLIEKEIKVVAPKPLKAKPLSAEEKVIAQIEQLGPGQSLFYRLGELYWSGLGGFLIVELNPLYPAKKGKYTMSTDRIAEGKPTGQKAHLWNTNKTREIAQWILERGGELYTD